MAELFQDKYRIKSSRLSGFDYSQDGYYFVTICTQNRENLFGKFRAGKMVLNELGKIVTVEWNQTAKIRHNVKLDAFVVMPNHLHGIVVIDNWNDGKNVETHCNAFLRNDMRSEKIMGTNVDRDVARNVSTSMAENFSKISPKSGSLAAIIRGFKSATTKRIHQIHPAADRIWQTRFHDHIIRGENELNRIREYIWQNPGNWEKIDENLKYSNAFATH
ncbi:MAG: transposase [Patescibacteria group bacterium]